MEKQKKTFYVDGFFGDQTIQLLKRFSTCCNEILKDSYSFKPTRIMSSEFENFSFLKRASARRRRPIVELRSGVAMFMQLNRLIICSK